MKKKAMVVLACLLTSAIMAACDPSQVERNAQSTEIAAGIIATQTAEAPTSTPTFTPTLAPTSTPTPKPTSTPTHTSMPAPTLTPLPAGWQDHPTAGFSIALPERWKVVDVDEEGIEAVWNILLGIDSEWARDMTAMFSDETTKEVVKFWAMDSEPAGSGYATLNIVPQAYASPIKVSDLCSQMPGVYEQMGIEMLGAKCDLAINGLDAARFLIRSQMGTLTVREYQYVVVQGPRTCILTFAAPETEWATHEPIFAQAADSFWIGVAVSRQPAQPTPPPLAQLGGTWYTTANGLVDNGVRSIAVAPNGDLWFGSLTNQASQATGGVSRFDGQSWTTYTTADGLVDNAVSSVAVAPNGTLWFGTLGGVSQFDGKRWTNYTTADGLANDHVASVAIAPDGVLWFGTGDGVSRFDGKQWTTYSTADGLPEGPISLVVLTPDGAVWACRLPGGLWRFDGTNWTTQLMASSKVNDDCLSLTVAPDGALWLGTPGGISRFDGQGWTVYTKADGLMDDRVSAFAVAPDGAWWFGTAIGISRFDGTTWTHYDTVHDMTSDVMPVNPVEAIVVAPNGALWFGTAFSGALRYSPTE